MSKTDCQNSVSGWWDHSFCISFRWELGGSGDLRDRLKKTSSGIWNKDPGIRGGMFFIR